MRRPRWWMLAGPATGAVALVLACLPQEEQTKYGGPEGLAGKDLPPPDPRSLNPDTPSDGSTKGICEGGTDPPDAGACSVSFKTDIFEGYIKPQGHCSDTGCHAPQSPRSAGQQPPIDPNSVDDTYNALVTYIDTQRFPGRRYVDPCSTNPENSAILCNLRELGPGKAGCGDLMPQAPGQTLDVAGLDKIQAWLKCGAPNN